jgi:D-alanine-D-alanine ligase
LPKLRILVLVHETLVPPETLDGVRDRDAAEYRTEFDVISCLRQCGHEVRPIGIGDSLTELRTTLADWRPQICFNLLEEFDGIVTYDQHIVAWLELLRRFRFAWKMSRMSARLRASASSRSESPCTPR